MEKEPNNPSKQPKNVEVYYEMWDNRDITKNGPETVLEHQNQGLAPSLDPVKNDKEDTASMVTQTGWHTEDSDFAIFQLEVAQQDYEHATHMRIVAAQNARDHGISNSKIGRIYKLTEGGIRHLLKKAGEATP